MRTIWESEVQTSKASRGNAKFWLTRVILEGGVYCTQSESWQTLTDGSEGAHNVSVPRKVCGKNVGRANETECKAQAISEAESDLRKKQDKGYHEVGEKPTVSTVLPMLAHKFNDRGAHVNWPAFIQPKLDGTRMLSDGKRGWSRNGKEHIASVFERFQVSLPSDVVALDGELMLPLHVGTFQDSVSASKADGEDTSKLVYYVYDYVPKDASLTFEERWQRLNKLVTLPSSIELVETKLTKNEAEAHTAHAAYVGAGFEGVMIRNASGLYKVGHRSIDLLKLKTMDDDEFECVGVKEGVGRDEGCAIVVVKCKGGVTDAVPVGGLAYRKTLWRNRRSLIGKMVTVKYQGYTDEGKLRFPNMIAIRDYE